MSVRRQHHIDIALLKRLEPLIHQPLQTYRGNGGVYQLDGDKKIRLTGNKHQTVSAAGRLYWEQILCEKAPLL